MRRVAGFGLLALLILIPQGLGQDSPFKRTRDKASKKKRGGRAKAEPWENRKAAEALVTEFAQAWADREKQAEILQRAKEIDEIPLSHVKKFIPFVHKAIVTHGLKLKSGPFGHPKFPGKVLVSGNKGGLVLGLHGGGDNSGDGANAARLHGGVAGKAGIGIFPTVLQKRWNEWGSKPEEQEYCYEVLKAAKRTFKIDPKQMYGFGFSMGGAGIWVVGSQLGDHFNAIVTGGGGPCTARFENLFRTPITIYHGEVDPISKVEWQRGAAENLKKLKEQHGPFDYEYIEAKGIGHKWPGNYRKQQNDFAFSKKKELFPKKFMWSPDTEWKKVFFWLKADAPIGRGRAITAEAKDDNEIHVDGNAPGLAVLLNDQLVDLSQPVKVFHNGSEVFSDTLKGSLIAILMSMDDKVDPTLALWAKVDLP